MYSLNLHKTINNTTLCINKKHNDEVGFCVNINEKLMK